MTKFQLGPLPLGFPSSLFPPPQEAGELLSGLSRQFIPVICKHGALPHSLHSSNGRKPRPVGVSRQASVLLGLGKPAGNWTRPQGTEDRAAQQA